MDAPTTTSPLTPLQIVGSISLATAFQIPLIFLPAGNWRWPEGWAYLAVFLLCMTFLTVRINQINPAVLQNRTKSKKGQWEGPDKVLMPILILTFIGQYVIMGLDAERFNWTSVHWLVKVAGALLIEGGYFIIYLVMKENAYASKVLVVEKDQGHKVITTGPYAVVRHPMYSGFSLLFLGTPLLLGSLWGLIPGVILGFLLLLRTYPEEDQLTTQLEGYPEYREQVQYRLIPFIV